jgi:hypothetical protein
MSHACNVAAGILPAVEGGILPPGPSLERSMTFSFYMLRLQSTSTPPGRMPGSTAAKMAAATTV